VLRGDQKGFRADRSPVCQILRIRNRPVTTFQVQKLDDPQQVIIDAQTFSVSLSLDSFAYRDYICSGE
jgi:hypothetical protein